MDNTKPRKNNRGYAKKGTTYHQSFDRSRKKLEDSHLNGWLSGLKKSYKRGTLSKDQYEEAVAIYKMNAGIQYGHKTYRVAQWWSRNG